MASLGLAGMAAWSVVYYQTGAACAAVGAGSMLGVILWTDSLRWVKTSKRCVVSQRTCLALRASSVGGTTCALLSLEALLRILHGSFLQRAATSSGCVALIFYLPGHLANIHQTVIRIIILLEEHVNI